MRSYSFYVRFEHTRAPTSIAQKLISMASWFSSWLPGLPSIGFSLPSGLQGRFISFVLKKSLGHLLKPGQLDSRQIDTQIGAGFVQVNDLELDNEVHLFYSLLSLPMLNMMSCRP